MEDIICAELAPICGRLWRIFACVNKSINARLIAAEAAIQTHKRATKYTSGTVIHSITAYGVLHGPFTILDRDDKVVVAGGYRLGQLHGVLSFNSTDIHRSCGYYNGRPHGLYKIIAGNDIRETEFKHGLLHGHSRWERTKDGLTNICNSDYVEGVAHGVDESISYSGDKVYPVYSWTYNMGRAHGRARSYCIDKKEPGTVQSALTFEAEYDDGKLKHLYPMPPDCPRKYTITRQFGRDRYVLWNGDRAEYSGLATYTGRMDELVMADDRAFNRHKVIYETRNRNQNGAYMEFGNEDNLAQLYMTRQFLMHGMYVKYNANGRAWVIKTLFNGFLHGTCKIYNYTTDGECIRIDTYNLMFGYDIGRRIDT